MLEVYDRALKKVAILEHALHLHEEVALNAVSYFYFSLPYNDSKVRYCQPFCYVRYNGGGLVTAVVQILDDILPEGTVVYTEDKNGHRETYTSSGDTYMEYPLAVLINEDSASASEILAGAIKDYEYGTLIGTTTFGKGIVQTIFPLEDGDAVKLTTAKYFTPNGNYIHGVGIDPDIELEYEYLNPDGTEYDVKYDNQIQKAVEVLTEELSGK